MSATFGKIGARPLIKPPYDAELDYIQWPTSDNDDFRVVVPGGDYPGFGLYFKVVCLASGYNLSPFGRPDGCIYTNWFVNDVYRQRSGRNSSAANNHILEWYGRDDGVNQISYCKDNGSIVGTQINIERVDCSAHEKYVLLGATNNNNTMRSGRFYVGQIFNFNNLVRHFIPVRKGRTGYIYDKITETLYSNAGTGAFVLGPDKVGGGG